MKQTLKETKFEYYNRLADNIRATYKAAKKEGNDQLMGVAHMLMEEHNKVIHDSETQNFQTLLTSYEVAKQIGNDYIDFDRPLSDEDCEDMVRIMKGNKQEYFTFSSTWSSAIRMAWAFERAGCKLEGLVRIKTIGQIPFSDEYVTAPAYLFKIIY